MFRVQLSRRIHTVTREAKEDEHTEDAVVAHATYVVDDAESSRTIKPLKELTNTSSTVALSAISW